MTARVQTDLERRYWGVFTIPLYSLWMRDDGVAREVYCCGSGGSARGKWREVVYTSLPAPISDGGYERHEHGRREVAFSDFLATHTPIPAEEWDRHRPPKQLDLIDEAHALERQLRRRRRLTPEREFALRWIGPAFHGNAPPAWATAPAR